MSLRRILWGENREAEHTTAKEWYRANRRELKKYRGPWIAYNHQGVISCDRDYDKMKNGVDPSLSGLDYVIERRLESEFMAPVSFPRFHCCN